MVSSDQGNARILGTSTFILFIYLFFASVCIFEYTCSVENNHIYLPFMGKCTNVHFLKDTVLVTNILVLRIAISIEIM